MNRLQYSPAANQDLIGIKLYISENLANPIAANRIVKNITQRIRRLSDHPYMGPSLSSIVDVETEYRFLVCGNYTSFYRVENEVVYIIRILYGKRDFMKILFGESMIMKDEEELE